MDTFVGNTLTLRVVGSLNESSGNERKHLFNTTCDLFARVLLRSFLEVTELSEFTLLTQNDGFGGILLPLENGNAKNFHDAICNEKKMCSQNFSVFKEPVSSKENKEMFIGMYSMRQSVQNALLGDILSDLS